MERDIPLTVEAGAIVTGFQVPEIPNGHFIPAHGTTLRGFNVHSLEYAAGRHALVVKGGDDVRVGFNANDFEILARHFLGDLGYVIERPQGDRGSGL